MPSVAACFSARDIFAVRRPAASGATDWRSAAGASLLSSRRRSQPVPLPSGAAAATSMPGVAAPTCQGFGRGGPGLQPGEVGVFQEILGGRRRNTDAVQGQEGQQGAGDGKEAGFHGVRGGARPRIWVAAANCHNHDRGRQASETNEYYPTRGFGREAAAQATEKPRKKNRTMAKTDDYCLATRG
jgi:hypothetical protein